MRIAGPPPYLPAWRGLLLLGAMLYALFTAILLYAGRLNMDEGWYLYASKLVYRGAVPYQDFAFTQTPLLPYLYGLPQLVWPGLWAGRLCSVCFSAATFAGLVWAARRISDIRGAALTAVLLSTFTYGIYFTTIVKTYALVSLLFALTLLALTARTPHPRKYCMAAVWAVLALLARLSALAFAIPILCYALIQAKSRRVRLAIAALVFAIGAASLALYLINPPAITWNLLSHHLDQWGDLSFAEKLGQILTVRLPEWIMQYWPYVVLTVILAMLTLLSRRKTEGGPEHFSPSMIPLLVYGLSLALFSAAHFVTGGWQVEYFVPAIIGGMPLLGSAAIRLAVQPMLPQAMRRLLAVLLCLVPLGSLATYGLFNLDLSGGQAPLQEVRKVAAHLTQHAASTDQVIALTALWTVVEADRDVPAGFSLALFSLQEMDSRTAQDLHLANCDRWAEALRSQRVRAVVLTTQDREWLVLRNCDQITEDILTTEYDRSLQEDWFGQRNETVEVFLHR